MIKNKTNNTCHSELVSGSYKGNYKRGAMFGLDARVALAIFGALSVITGATLYSAMKEAKVVALLTEFDNVDKATTEYLLNTGSYIPADTTNASRTNNGFLNIKELVDSSVSGWRGPYIDFALLGAITYVLQHPIYGSIFLSRKQDTAWDNPYLTTNTCLLGSVSCSVYICIDNMPQDIRLALDLKIDGIEGPDSGNFRHSDASGYACKKGMVYDKSLSPASIL